jgi:uncharacterized protein YyaL (SSP411 family)
MSARFHFSPRPNRAHEIAWRDWGDAAFEEAKREGKPVLLSLSAVWCHWCHVMDETSYSDPNVIVRANELFVPIRVDADERPDINSRYNLGGWPTTAFLTADGFLLGGATYVPPQSMKPLLDDVSRAWAEQRDAISQRIAERIARSKDEPASSAAMLSAGIVDTVAASVIEAYDPHFGGLGTEPKFPHPPAFALLLMHYERTGDMRLLTMVLTTLRAMALGGMYDAVEGGFFRYSTTQDWSVPHFEKMLEDHGGLLPLYARAWTLTKEDQLREALEKAIGFLRAVLRDPQSGLFGGSQDADEEYYLLTLEKRREREAPYVDRTVFAGWNAGIASAFLRSARALGDRSLETDALTVLDALRDRFSDERGLLYHFARPGEAPQVRNLLGDQVSYLRALIDAHETTGEQRFLDRAVALADRIDEVFVQPDGALGDHANEDEALGMMRFIDRPVAENASAADSLLRLSAMTLMDRFRDRALAILRYYVSSYEQQKYFAAPYAIAVARALSEDLSITIVGTPEATTELRKAALEIRNPMLVVTTLSSEPEAKARSFTWGEPAAYVCRGTACSAPVHEPASLADALSSFSRASA